MGKSTARKNYTTPNKGAAASVRGKAHVNYPVRKPTAKHDSVVKKTKATARAKAQEMNSALPGRASGPQPGSVTAKPLSKPVPNLDQFGNPLSPNNDSFFDEGATA